MSCSVTAGNLGSISVSSVGSMASIARGHMSEMGFGTSDIRLVSHAGILSAEQTLSSC